MNGSFYNKIWKRMMALLLLGALLILGISGCGTKEESVMTGIRFDRGHGSVWGNQFYIEVQEKEIVKTSFFQEGAQDQTVCEHVPITVQQWEEICKAVETLELVEDRPSLIQKVLGNRKLDGGEYRTLTLLYEEEEIAYKWPADGNAQELEALLEQLVKALQEEPEVPEVPEDPQAPAEDVPVGNEDTYWVAETWQENDGEEAGKIQFLDPALWRVDLWINVDGTACMRDVHNGISLMDDSCRNLVWERTPEGEFLFYSILYPDPLLRATYKDGVLTVQYWSQTLYMKQQPMPQTAGQKYLPAELAGTWLMVSGETEGYQWESMPGKLASMVFRVSADDFGELELVADTEELDYYGQMENSGYNLKTELLNEPLYHACENEAWSIRVGEASAVDDNGYPLQTEVYATLLDHNTLLVQQYYTLDGAPAVSYQTYRRFTELVSWMSPDSMNLDYSNWICTGFESISEEAAPAGMENLSVMLCPDGTCTVQFGDGSTQNGTWAMGAGGAVLLRGDENAEEPFWLGGAITGYWVETSNGPSETYQMALYGNGGILMLALNAYG